MVFGVPYCRVSREDKHRPGVSPEVQAAGVLSFCSSKGLSCVSPIVDRGVSAGIPLNRRDGGKELVELLRAGNCALVIMRLDRLFRRVDDGSYWLRRWNKEGVQVFSVTEQVDFGTPSGMLLAHMLLAAAEYEHQLAGERTRAVRRRLKSEGKLLGGQAPYGWKVGEGKLLVKDRLEQGIRSRILRLNSFGHGPEKIAKILNSEGEVSRSGKPWCKGSVRSVLRRAGRGPGRLPVVEIDELGADQGVVVPARAPADDQVSGAD